jgi:hypothetical protein
MQRGPHNSRMQKDAHRSLWSRLSGSPPPQEAFKQHPLTDALRMPGLPPDEYAKMAKRLPKDEILDVLKRPAAVPAQLHLVKRLETTVPEWERLLRSKVLASPEAQTVAAQKMFALCSDNDAPGVMLAGIIAAYSILKEVCISEAAQERLAALITNSKDPVYAVDILRNSPNITSAKAQDLLVLSLASLAVGETRVEEISKACFDLLCAGAALSSVTEERLAMYVATYLPPAYAVEARRAGNIRSDSAKEILDRSVYARGTEAMVSEIMGLCNGTPIKVDRTFKIH